MNALVGFLDGGNVQLTLAAATGMVCVLALAAGVRSLFGSRDEVAERLNITKPTLYYYVNSKDEILYECVRMGLTMLQEAIQAAGTSGGSALDKLVVAMRKYAEIVATAPTGTPGRALRRVPTWSRPAARPTTC